MSYSISLQMSNKNAIIFYQKNWSSYMYIFEASNKYNELLGRTNSVDRVLTFTDRIISLLPANVSVTGPSGQ